MQQTEIYDILGHFLPLLPLDNQENQQSYDVCFLTYGVQQTEIFVILDYFLPFYLPNTPKNQNFEKMKKTPRDIILPMCTINDNHMMYGSWGMEHVMDRTFCYFGPVSPFYPPNNPKMKILKKLKI